MQGMPPPFMNVVVIGGGEIGRAIAEALAHERNEVQIIELDEDVVASLQHDLDVRVIAGSGSDPAALRKAGIQAAELVAVVTDRDEDNLCAATLARFFAPQAKIIARIRNPELAAERRFLIHGPPRLTHVLNPELLAANSIFRSIRVPSAIQVTEFEMGRLLLVGVRLPDTSALAGSTVAGFARSRQKDHGQPPLLVARYRENQLVVPKGDTAIEQGDVVYFVTTPSSLRRHVTMLGLPFQKQRAVAVFGATVTGLHLARLMHEAGISVKLVEPDRKLATAASERLPEIVVLHAEPTDPQVWADEDLGQSDAIAAVCRDEEVNLMVALMGRRAGVVHTAALTNRSQYVPLLLDSGITTVVSPRNAAIGTVLRFLRRGRVLQVAQTEYEDAELLEYEVSLQDPISGMRLMDLGILQGAIVASTIRGDDVLIPTGASRVQAGDRILLFTRKEVVHDVESMLLARQQ